MTLKIGLIGSGYIASVHYYAYKALGYEITAHADPDEAKFQKFLKLGCVVKEHYPSHKEMIERSSVDVVSVCVPNFLHFSIIKDLLEAGKHVIVEKPLCLNLKEADVIIDLAKQKGLLVGYAEELCYVPKYKRVKMIADTGGLGEIYMVRQSEKHSGPHSPWFFQRKSAGGGALMDMGCHSIEFCRWIKKKQPVKWVQGHCAKYFHKHSEVEDHVTATLGFEDGSIGMIEASWALQGGDDSVAAVFGTEGVAYADMLKSTGLKIYSKQGFPSMPGHPGDLGGDPSRGWTTPDFNWLFNNGYTEELQDFLNCIQKGGTPLETAEDGRIVLEIMAGIYLSAGTGKKIALPLTNTDFIYPIDLWQKEPNS